MARRPVFVLGRSTEVSSRRQKTLFATLCKKVTDELNFKIG